MIRCKKQNITVEFDELKGALHSLQLNGKEYVKEQTDIFRLSCRDEKGKQILTVSSEMKAACPEQREDGFVCQYVLGKIAVVISCKLTEEVVWGIDVSVPDTLVCEWVNYPQIAVDYDLSDRGGNSKILWGFNEGVIVDSIEHREGGFPYLEPAYPGEGVMGLYPAIVETQFMAYFNEKGGLYFAAHDREDCLKGIDFYPYKDGILLQFRHYSGCHFGENYHMPYPMVMKAFEGDWYSAAQIYRDWFEQEPKPGFVPIKENKNLPKWYGDSPVVVTYPVRGVHDTDVMNPNKLFPYINAMPHIERLEKELDSKIMVILMHWEGSAPWAPPYVWPPFGGEAELKKFIDALHERGDVIGVYCSGIGWTEQSNLIDEYNKKEEFDKKGLAGVMCLSPEQTLPYSKICPDQRRGYDMCPTQDFTIHVMQEEVKKMAGSGLDYIQLFDQNHGGNSYFCYSRTHGHPPVPGKWQTDAVKHLLREVERCADSKVLFGCESAAAESYIPYLLFNDNRFNLNYRIGVPVPVYAYVYHKYLNNFMGNQVSTQHFLDHEKSPDNVLMRIAYSFAAGDLMTLVINPDGEITWNWGMRTADIPEQESIKRLVKNLNSWRTGCGKKYLHTGEMTSPWRVVCDKHRIYSKRGYEIPFDSVFSSAWKADGGKTGQFLINYHDRETACTVELPEGEYLLYKSTVEKETVRGGNHTVKIAPLSAVLIEEV